MLGQATAMLVSFSTLLAAQLSAALLPILGKRLAVAGSPNAGLVEPGFAFIGRHVIRVIINCSVLALHLRIHEPLCGETGGRGGQAAHDSGPSGRGFGHGTTARVAGNGEWGDLVAGLVQGGSDSGDVGTAVTRHTLSPCYAVGGIEGAGQCGV